MWKRRQASGASPRRAMGGRCTTAAVIGLVLLGGFSIRAHPQAGQPARSDAVRARTVAFTVTPVSGPSWLEHLHISFDVTSMGRMGQNTPPPTIRYEPKWNQLAGSEDLNGRFVLSGSDLYRLDCESCHQPDGHGSPPEIHSLVAPVQATSAAFLEQRMKAAGRPIAPAMAQDMAKAGEQAIRDRLLHGGQRMPPFEHLQGPEVDALIAFLKQLAGVPGAEREQQRVVEPFTRVGEHLIKGTCHVCHAATGPGTNPEALLHNVLPSLASFPRDKTIFQVIQKARSGAPIEMGTLRQPSGGRMPVFSYLTDAEIGAAYLYLIIYPPR
ncbi:MAG: c-type cytochrome [Bacteroidales bacterium]